MSAFVEEIAGWLRGLLTPVIAVIATYIAYQQYKNNKLKLKFDLYEKRFRVYQALVDFISFVISFPEIKVEEVRKLDSARAESHFLFGEDIPQYLLSVRDKAAQLTTLNSQVNELASSDRNPERTKLVNQKLEVIEWFHQQLEESRKKFGKYLSFPS
jgi:hypothetical protein